MPVEELLEIIPVTLSTPVMEIVSHPRVKEICTECGEEIFNDRQVVRDENPYCLGCVGRGYYQNEVIKDHISRNGK